MPAPLSFMGSVPRTPVWVPSYFNSCSTPFSSVPLYISDKKRRGISSS